MLAEIITGHPPDVLLILALTIFVAILGLVVLVLVVSVNHIAARNLGQASRSVSRSVTQVLSKAKSQQTK